MDSYHTRATDAGVLFIGSLNINGCKSVHVSIDYRHKLVQTPENRLPKSS